MKNSAKVEKLSRTLDDELPILSREKRNISDRKMLFDNLHKIEFDKYLFVFDLMKKFRINIRRPELIIKDQTSSSILLSNENLIETVLSSVD